MSISKVSKKYSDEIEVVSSAIIENSLGKILLTKSLKWNNKWVLPGGHVKFGETIFKAVIREIREETELKINPIYFVNSGELIHSQDFYRDTHFIYFDVYCKLVGGQLKLDKRELVNFIWVLPEDALSLDLAESYPETIQKYIEYKKIFYRHLS